VSAIALDIQYLVMSCISLLIQCRKLYTLISRWPVTPTLTETQTHRGLLRTSLCRVLAAMVYVGLAAESLRDQSIMTPTTDIVLTAIQLMWIANAFADVRLWRYLSRHTTPASPRRSTTEGAP
jgi:hypothetical protein